MALKDPLAELLWLSHELGRESRGLALPGEGSVSARLDALNFGIRASSTSLHDAQMENVCRCQVKEMATFLDSQGADAGELQQALSRYAGEGNVRPTTEALFHACLHQLEGVQFVGHCHPEACLQILCSPAAERFAECRMYPDEILATGPQSVLVPYVEPGAPLAREVRAKVDHYMRRHFGRVPRIVLMQNHGIAAIGASAQSVLTALLMVEKAARIFVGASRMGGPVFMTQAMVTRIDSPGRTRR